MSTIAYFRCSECGHGLYEVEDNADAPIPNPPISIHHDDAEGRPVTQCRQCDAMLPEFERRPRKTGLLSAELFDLGAAMARAQAETQRAWDDALGQGRM